jgi:hypothetical protein
MFDMELEHQQVQLVSMVISTSQQTQTLCTDRSLRELGQLVFRSLAQPDQQGPPAQRVHKERQVHKALRGFKALLVQQDQSEQQDQSVQQGRQALCFSRELAPPQTVWATTGTCTSPLIYQGCMDLSLLGLGPLGSL